jgi:hypothetical protein
LGTRRRVARRRARFIAGATAYPRESIVKGADGAAWAARLHESHGFMPIRDNMQRFARIAYPEEVLVGRSLQEQGESLGRWVVATYRALYAAGPPPDISGPPPE